MLEWDVQQPLHVKYEESETYSLETCRRGGSKISKEARRE